MSRRARPTLQEVARLAGVSPATVSRSLSRPGLVNLETLQRVRRAAESMGYVPTGAAQALASGRSRTIGAVVPTLDSAIFARTLQSVQATLAGQGYQLLVASNDYNPAAEVAILRALLSRGVDGLILVGAQRDEEAWRLLERAAVPVVLTLSADPRFDGVVVDNHRAGRLAAEHLLSLGHRTIGVVTGKLSVNDRQRQRVAGVRDAMAAAGCKLPDWRVLELPMTTAGGRSGCAALLAAAEPPTAIVCGVDILAIGCLSEAHARGIRVPDALSIVGIDNLEMAANVSPALTTVHVPTDRIGEHAARTILLRLNGRPGPRIEELPVELVVRQSSARRHGGSA
jgi:LacI family transcriptional regulator